MWWAADQLSSGFRGATQLLPECCIRECFKCHQRCIRPGDRAVRTVDHPMLANRAWPPFGKVVEVWRAKLNPDRVNKLNPGFFQDRLN
jgi:hypothetical protein